MRAGGARTRSPTATLTAWAVGYCLLAASCIVDGRYLVKVRVVGWHHGAQVSVPSAAVSVRSRGSRGDGDTPFSAGDGMFELYYTFGGMMPFVWSDGHPIVEVSAAGHQTCSVRLRSDVPTPGVTRGTCSEDLHCYTIDVLLTPDYAGQNPGNTATCK